MRDVSCYFDLPTQGTALKVQHEHEADVTGLSFSAAFFDSIYQSILKKIK